MKKLTCPECGGFAWFLDVHFPNKIECWTCWESFSIARTVKKAKVTK